MSVWALIAGGDAQSPYEDISPRAQPQRQRKARAQESLHEEHFTNSTNPHSAPTSPTSPNSPDKPPQTRPRPALAPHARRLSALPIRTAIGALLMLLIVEDSRPIGGLRTDKLIGGQLCA